MNLPKNRERIRSSFCLTVLCLLLAAQLGSQSTNARVVITQVPGWGQDGKISGYVSGVSAEQVRLYVMELIPDMGWFSLSGCGSVSISSTGAFSVESAPGILGRNATRFSAYLLPSSLSPPCVQGTATVPFVIQQNALSMSTLPRLARYGTLYFSGMTWSIKSAPLPIYPGPQFFVEPNAFVDSLGQLHLRVSKCSDQWCSAEVFTTDAVGYGTYTFTVNSQLNNIDPNLTLGLFTWDTQAGSDNFREWDIEFGRWGNASATANAQYVVQPYTAPGSISRFLMSPASASTHTVTWLPNTVQFRSYSNASQISQWAYEGSPLGIPTPGDARLHLNFYVARGNSPTVPVNQEIVISNLQYVPSGAQTGFATPSSSAPFLASTMSVPTRYAGPGCSATIESDSPWLLVTSRSVASGQSVTYSTTDNIGTPRTGNLIMQSTNCNVEIGRQVFPVIQAGFVCSPIFDSGSTHIGFLQTVRSVLVRGTASACSWTVNSSVPWLRIVSSNSGTGDRSIDFSADANTDLNSRVGALLLDNGQQHFVNQDASGSSLALTPLQAPACNGRMPQFSASWVSTAQVDLRINTSTGPVIGSFGTTGSVKLPELSDGTLIYLLSRGTTNIIASARVSVVGTDCNAPQILAQGIVNAASFAPVSLAPGALATLRGNNLGVATLQAQGLQYPTSLGGYSVLISGIACPLLYVSPTQINFLVPDNLPPGRHLLAVGTATADVLVSNSSPGLFTLSADGSGVPLAVVVAVNKDGTNTQFAPYGCDATRCSPAPIALPAETVDVYLVLYGTGLRHARNPAASIGGSLANVAFFGAHTVFPGLDQINLQITNLASLAGKTSLVLQTDGVFSNAVDLTFQ